MPFSHLSKVSQVVFYYFLDFCWLKQAGLVPFRSWQVVVWTSREIERCSTVRYVKRYIKSTAYYKITGTTQQGLKHWGVKHDSTY